VYWNWTTTTTAKDRSVSQAHIPAHSLLALSVRPCTSWSRTPTQYVLNIDPWQFLVPLFTPPRPPLPPLSVRKSRVLASLAGRTPSSSHNNTLSEVFYHIVRTLNVTRIETRRGPRMRCTFMLTDISNARRHTNISPIL